MEWRTSTVCILLLALTGIQVDSKTVYPSNHVNNICSMWGNFHFKTFDGDVYQFPGMCEYNLVSDCQSLIRQFSVHVKRTEHSTGPNISRVSITINDIGIELTEKQVVVNGEKVTLPVHVAGILVEENTIYIRLYSKMGITVMWNKEDAVMVELDSKYSSRTCGLCGDFNGVPVYSEFIESGRRVGYAEFGNKYRVPNPTHVCEDPFENDDEQNVVDKCEKFRADCADLLEDEKWSSCSWVLNTEPYIKACTNDICSSQPEDEDSSISALCATLSEYSRQCSHAGGTPPSWRTANFCAVKCPYNMVHSESGSPCMDTCLHKDTNALCEEHNSDGCFCPPGTVFDDISNTGCIPAEKCQCKHDRVYSTGEILREDEEECICKEGSWICTSIPGPGLCSVEEGSHFTTFDGKEFTFHGDCNYVLSKDCKESKFIILGLIVPCFTHQTDTCLKSVVVLFDNDMKNPLIIKADGTVQHNAEISLPYMTAGFTVFMPSSFHIMLQTTFGLQVQVQLVPLMQVYITVDQSFQGKTCGLCGNFNKVLSDDLKTPQGVVEGTAVSFANAWKAQSNCPDRTERLDDPCSYSSDSEHFAEHWCSKMKDKESLFAKCHTTVNPDSYYKRCKYSSCTCEKSEDCLCTVFSAYARACAAKGIILQGWRDIVCKKYTENCPASQNYSYELQNCQRTCLSLASERQSCSVDFVPVDGCACPEGLYQDENGLCVPMEKCPCHHNGQKIHSGKSVTIRDEHCVCMNGKLHCRSWKTRSLGCSSPKVFFNCSTAAPDEHGLECAKTCLQQEVDCFSLDCQSGCQCPLGLLDDGRGHCVKPDYCSCKHNGLDYAPGAEISIDCNQCTCQRGKWNCTRYKCPGICAIYGSGRYITFDQQRFSFRGDCSYIAAQNKCGNKTGTFRVITENMPCGTTGTTCSKAVKILLGRTLLQLVDGNVMAIDSASGPKIEYTEKIIGMYLVIDANIGLTVLWDRKTTVRIILQPQLMGDVCGLCGNFNGNGKDDFTTQGNLPTSNILEFVDSWKGSKCPDAKPDDDPCLETPNRETWAKIQCSIIKDINGPFKVCHNTVEPISYYENCVKDSCACDTGGDCECFCTAVAAYAQACNEADVCVNWRTPEICPVYCDFYNNGTEECIWHYNPCHTPFYKTCLNLNGVYSNNSLPLLEGCYPKCPKDTPIFDEENQICVETCISPSSTTTPEPTTSSTPTPTTTTMSTTTTPEPTTSSTPTPTTTTMSTTTTPEPTTSSTPTPTTTTMSTTTTPEPTTSSTPTPTTTTMSTTKTPEPTTSFTSTSTCICICWWSDWFNEYHPGAEGHDLETYENIRESGKEICKEPVDIECRAVAEPDMSFDEYIKDSKQVAQCNVSYGLVCKKEQQNARPYKCFDYEIRVNCCSPCCPTSSPPTTTTTTKSTTTPEPTTSSTPTPTTTTMSTTTTPEPTTSSTPTTTTTKSTTTTPEHTTPCTPPPTLPCECPEWAKNFNGTFYLCGCYMARCRNDCIVEVFPLECPPLQNITCENGKDPVLVYDEYHCCQYYACDCVCEGWGDPHYRTFDGHFYSYQGNCTYVLMEEISPRFNLKIDIESVYCDPVELVSCPRSIIVSYNNLVITLINHNLMGGADLEAFENNKKIPLPYARNGVRVVSSGLNLILTIPLRDANITFGATGFEVSLSYHFFGNNTQGHCGTCNNNQADDCMIPGGILVDDCAVMADYWPASEICTPTAKTTSKPCPVNPDCDLLKSDLFKECHSHQSPENFFLACEYDSCHMSNPAVVCTSLQAYARSCSQLGICIHWRNYTNLCNIECPADKVFNPCGPAEPPTCADIPGENTIKVPTEGCFCPEGSLLFNKESGACVNKCGCLDASGTPREFDEVFVYNCEECICDKASKSVKCPNSKKCPDVNPVSCTEPGFVLVNATDPSDPCCSKQVCNCDVNMCPPMDTKCAVGYAPVLEVPDGKCCPVIKCEPKKVCVHKNVEYEPGTNVHIVDCQECSCTWDMDPKTQFFQIKCELVQCNKKCDPGYEYDDTNFDDCCGKCVQTHCNVNVNGVDHTLKEGETLPSANQGCDRITCTKVNGQFITNKYTVQCPPFNISNCQPGTVQLSSDGCCKVCSDQMKGCQVQTVLDYINHNDCQSEKRMDLTFCGGDCASFSRYTEPGLSSCTCCLVTHASNRTVNLSCINGDVVAYSYIHVEECACSRTNCHKAGVGHTLIEDSQRKRSLGLP
ncbi:mucin-2-like [Sinocyclocheilus grahami]|uniref:mucin-2-like n=1 Tax=Sinocyclocheilus grahami TaxID=75366 RepID=UPI0007ACFF0B|nr:PREDICTED: mucin-2-like [Sinocyclocheilus grahami]